MPASSHDADAILLFGGDGTIHRHLGQLVKLNLPVLVVPAGSGNDFARALQLKNIRDSLAAWKKFCAQSGNVYAIDLGTISTLDRAGESPAPHNPRYFCCVAGIGLDAEVARRANHLPRWLRGHGGYALSLIPTVVKMAPFPLKILTPTDHNNWSPTTDQPTILAAFANTPVYGGGMKIAPRAQMDDGLLDVCVIGAVDPFKLFCMFPTVYGGHHLKIKEVKYFSTSRARIETERPLEVYADGEFVCQTPIEISVEPRSLRVITL
ncbi:MAG TPA: diacylglycerol kinase family protein [Candidatus Solibacter sp.]|nr:diacylglycerol kinase family protein [Candidatus Solibacter sp.]